MQTFFALHCSDDTHVMSSDRLETTENLSKLGKNRCATDCTNGFKKKSEFSFYNLAKSKEQNIKWIAGIHPDNWNPGPETGICREQFVSTYSYVRFLAKAIFVGFSVFDKLVSIPHF